MIFSETVIQHVMTSICFGRSGINEKLSCYHDDACKSRTVTTDVSLSYHPQLWQRLVS